MRNHTATQQRYTSLEDLLRERDIVVSRFIMGAVAAWGAIDHIDNALLFRNQTLLLLAGDQGRFELVRWERETEDFPPDVKNIQLEAFGTAAIESVVVRPDPNPTLRLALKEPIMGVREDQPTGDITVRLARSVTGLDELIYQVQPFADPKAVETLLQMRALTDTPSPNEGD